MKRNLLMISITAFFVILLMLTMSNKVFAADLSKIEVTVPAPTIGKTLAKASEITVKADGSEKFEVFQVDWMEYDYSADEYKDVTNLSKKVGPDEKYIVTVHYKRPEKYEVTSSTKITLNGKTRSMSNPEEFNNYGGETGYHYDGVGYYFEKSQVQKNLSKIEVTVPAPTIGKTLAKASEVTAKADGSESLKVNKIEWFKYNESSKEYESVTNTNAIINADEKYEILVDYSRPHKYGVISSTKVTVNGNALNKDNIEQYNEYGGDSDNEYTAVCYKFEAKVQKNLSKIEVTVPAPTIGKTLARASEVTVKADGSESLKVNKIEWFKYNESSKEYESVTNTNAIINVDEKYEILVDYSKPHKYGVISSTKVTVNGNTLNKDNIEQYNEYGGDSDNEYTTVCYKFEAKVQKNLSKIEVTVPAPTTGKTLAKASEVTVKADGSESLKVNKIEWFKYNAKTKEYEEVKNTSKKIEANEKYEILVDYSRPHKYRVTATTKITVNGNNRDLSNIEEYNEYGGDSDNEYTAVCYKFAATKAQTSTTKPNDTTTGDKGNSNQQTTKPSTTEPSTTKPADKENIKDETVNNEKVDNETVENQIVMPDNNNVIDTNNQTNISNGTIGATTTEKGNENTIKVEYILYIVSGILGIALAFIAYKVFIYSKDNKEEK